ncbi:MAG: LacI family DNA-binding transcriptional regulator [Sedimentisphaeraceae bacterium JB056]
MAKTVTLQMIADKVGVSKSTVSDVLRARVAKVKVSENTRDRIFQAVKELNYVPNAAARALVTGKTNNIGFLLSSKTNLGLANNYFTSIMSGVQAASVSRGFNCIVNCYDLSSVKEFVMPSKVRRKVVDGIVISGPIEENVLQMFVDSGIPFILVGENADFSVEGVLAVARNISEDWIRSFNYLYDLGHRKIAVGGIETELGYFKFKEAIAKFKEDKPQAEVQFSTYNSPVSCGDVMEYAYKQGQKWCKQSDRPTAVIGHDQWCLAFVSSILDAGYDCPEDVSVISTCDTVLCKWFRPSITSIVLPLYEGGKRATELLIDYINRDVNWMQANRLADTIWEKHDLVVRDSTAEICK